MATPSWRLRHRPGEPGPPRPGPRPGHRAAALRPARDPRRPAPGRGQRRLQPGGHALRGPRPARPCSPAGPRTPSPRCWAASSRSPFPTCALGGARPRGAAVVEQAMAKDPAVAPRPRRRPGPGTGRRGPAAGRRPGRAGRDAGAGRRPEEARPRTVQQSPTSPSGLPPPRVAGPTVTPGGSAFCRQPRRAPQGPARLVDSRPDLSRRGPLDPGLGVQLVGWWGEWAHIRCSNGWEAWVNGRLLRPV